MSTSVGGRRARSGRVMMARTCRLSRLRSTAFLETLLATTTVAREVAPRLGNMRTPKSAFRTARARCTRAISRSRASRSGLRNMLFADNDAPASFCTSASQDAAAARRTHTGAVAVALKSALLFWLVGSLWHVLCSDCDRTGLQGDGQCYPPCPQVLHTSCYKLFRNGICGKML